MAPAGFVDYSMGGLTGFPGALTRYWLMEEEDDDDMHFLVDDADEEAFLYYQLVQGESCKRRRRSNGPPKEIRPRDLLAGDLQIRRDYFDANCVFNDRQFRERFRMRRPLVLRIVDAVEAANPLYFTRKRDCCGKEGFSALQKCVAALRILAYGLPAHAVDEYVRIGASIAREALGHFCTTVIKEFGPYYLRAPTDEDVARLLEENKERGFSGMLGSIDCMHWEWRMCPTTWKGMFTGRGKHPSMILEAIASHDLHIWHAYFGMPGSNNDINVLQSSPVFSNYIRGRSTPVEFEVNGNTYNMGYYLADGIYPEWPAFMKSIRHPMEAKTQHFSKRQESCRKDIERAFGVLRVRFAVVRGPAYGWNPKQIKDIMMCCINLHNMIVEDEGENAGNTNFQDIGYIPPVYENNPDRQSFVAARHRLQNRNGHFQLQHDLIEHLWMLVGSNNV